MHKITLLYTYMQQRNNQAVIVVCSLATMDGPPVHARRHDDGLSMQEILGSDATHYVFYITKRGSLRHDAYDITVLPCDVRYSSPRFLGCFSATTIFDSVRRRPGPMAESISNLPILSRTI